MAQTDEEWWPRLLETGLFLVESDIRIIGNPMKYL